MSESKIGVEILSSGPVTVRQSEAPSGWGGSGQTVYVEGEEVAGIQISRNGEAAYFLRIASNGTLTLTTYQGVLSTVVDTNLRLTPNRLWED